MKLTRGLDNFTQTGAGAVSRTIRDRLKDRISVKDFGAVGDGTTDDTTAFTNAVAFSGGRCAIYVPHGTYKVTDTISFTLHRLNIYGDGQQSSVILFAPSTTGKACFHFTGGGSPYAALAQVYVKGLAFDATGNAQGTKAAIRLTDCEEVIIDDIAVNNWSSAGKDCIGLQFRGRQTHDVGHITVNADIPISIEANPSSVIDADQYHFHDCYLIADLTTPVVQIATGVNLTNVVFDGYQVWAQGKHGLYWLDTTTASVGSNLTLQHVRWEQATDNTGYFAYVSHNFDFQNLSIIDCRGGLDSNWVYLRKCSNVILQQHTYVGTLVALDANSTVDGLELSKVWFADAGVTVNLTALKVDGMYRYGGNIKVFSSSASAGAGVEQQFNPSATLGFSQLEPKTVTIGASTAVKFAGDTHGGIVLIYTSTGFHGIIGTRGSGHSTVELSDPDGVFGIAAAASNFNLYWNGGTSDYRFQNNTGGSVTFYFVSMGSGER